MAKSWNFDLYIDGKWTTGEAAGSIEVINPANRGGHRDGPEATTKDAVLAIEAARRAFDEGPWPYTKPAERAAALVRMAEVPRVTFGELRELIVAETGSTGFMTDYVQAAGSIGMFRSNAAQIEHVVRVGRGGCPHGRARGNVGIGIVPTSPSVWWVPSRPSTSRSCSTWSRSPRHWPPGAPWCSSPTRGPRSTRS